MWFGRLVPNKDIASKHLFDRTSSFVKEPTPAGFLIPFGCKKATGVELKLLHNGIVRMWATKQLLKQVIA